MDDLAFPPDGHRTHISSEVVAGVGVEPTIDSCESEVMSIVSIPTACPRYKWQLRKDLHLQSHCFRDRCVTLHYGAMKELRRLGIAPSPGAYQA